jgi:hypothetical protein
VLTPLWVGLLVVRTDLVKLFGISGIMLFPFCFVKKDAPDRTVRHEKIHLKQAINLLVIPFYLLYFIFWVRCLFMYGKKAYYYICFEQEAYRNEFKLDYKVKYNWTKYISKSSKIKLWKDN